MTPINWTLDETNRWHPHDEILYRCRQIYYKTTG